MNNWIWRGRAWVYGDDVPNDEGLMPLALVRAQEHDPAVLARHCFEQLDPDFSTAVNGGDIVFGGHNFAYGNPHIQGFLALKGCGVGVVARSMPRGALRACINAGVPVLVGFDFPDTWVKTSDTVSVNFETGHVENLATGASMDLEPMAGIMREIVAAGGGIGYMLKRLGMATTQRKA